jgi:hypothetical protein
MNVDRRLLNLVAALASTLGAFGALVAGRRRGDGGTLVAVLGLISSAAWAAAAYSDYAEGQETELA